jgi:membrane protein required for colicin V production
LNPADAIILGVLGASGLLGLLRGFVREILALAGWIAGLVLAALYGAELGAWAAAAVPWSPVRTALGAVAIVVGCVLVCSLLGAIARRLMAAAKLSSADRGLGGFFGLVRGIVVVLLAVALGRTLGLAQHPLWRASALLPYAEAALRWADPLLPSLAVPGRSRAPS